MDPVFLSIEEALRIQEDQVARYGGSPGVRDWGLLESALAMPSSGFGGAYFHADLYETAAAYLFHIVKNHPFVDGNKRVGAVSAALFLHMNDVRFEAKEDALVEMTLAVAEGRADKAEIAAFFRANCAPAD